jgi:hypothetical protein
MAFPSAGGTKANSLADAWDRVRAVAAAVKRSAQNLNTLSLAGPIAGTSIVRFCGDLADARDTFTQLAAVSGLGAYAQEQVADPALNIANEFTAMLNAIDSTRTWITTNFPKDGGGFLLAVSFDANGRTVERTFDTATLAGFRTQLAALISTID